MKSQGTNRAATNNHANQLNPNNAAYRSSRGTGTPATTPAAGAAKEEVPADRNDGAERSRGGDSHAK